MRHCWVGRITDDSDDSGSTSRGEGGAGLAFQLALNHKPPTWPANEVPQQFHLDLDVPDLEEAASYAESLGRDTGRGRRPGGQLHRAPRPQRSPVLRLPLSEAVGPRAGGHSVTTMTKWEYVTVPLLVHATKQILDNWGQDGWELVQVVPGLTPENLVAYLKRPVPGCWWGGCVRAPSSRLAELGLTLPAVAAPLAAYVPAVRVGELIYSSGQLPSWTGSCWRPARSAAEVSLDQAVECARTAALNALAAVAAEAGDLDAIAQVIKVVVFVASAPDFTGQPQVGNGASQLLRRCLWRCRRGMPAARSASRCCRSTLRWRSS